MHTPDASPQTYKMIYGNYSGCNYSIYPGNATGFVIYNANNSSTVNTGFGFGPKSPSGCPDSISWNTSESSWVYDLAVNKWCHFVMTSDDGTNYRIYVNGVQRGSTKTFDFKNSSSRSANNLMATSNYSWGGSHVSNEANQVDFSTMRIYNRPLTQTEIKKNYQSMFSRFLGPNIATDGLKLITSWSSLAALTSRTADAVMAPDGTMTATLFERVSISPSGHAQIRQSFPTVDLIPNTAYSVSFWARRISLTQTLDFEFSDTPQQSVTLTDSWEFYSFSLTTTATFPVGEFIDIGSTTVTNGSQLGEKYSIWNLHVSLH
jgi:hypothetical protein